MELRRDAGYQSSTKALVLLNERYRDGLRRLAALAGPADRVAVIDVGQPLYVLRQPVFDLGGLTSPEASAYFADPTTSRCIPPPERDVSDLSRRFGVRYLAINDWLWRPMLPNVSIPGMEKVDLGAIFTLYRLSPPERPIR